MSRSSTSQHASRTLVRLTFMAVIATTTLAMSSVSAVAASKPSISKISPTTGPLGGGTTVTITGSHFTSSSTVTFGSAKAQSVSYSSSSKLIAKAPANPAGAVSVKVKTSAGTSGSETFTYRVPPSISAVSPATGSPAGGAKLTITGASFVDPTTVTFGGTPVTATVVSTTKLTLTAPKHDAGEVSLVASNKYGTSSSPAVFDYVASAPSTLLKVGSFNVRVASGSHDKPETKYEQPWTSRLPVVAGQIERADLDVVGIQEASASSKYTAGGVSQFDDIVTSVGSPYKLTNDVKYCDASSTSTVACPNGASSSDRILYDSDRVTPMATGSRKLDSRSFTDGSGRYMVWAAFQDVQTPSKKFFFVSTHLEPGTAGATRKTEVNLILDEIALRNTSDLPVIIVGDLGSTKFDKETVGGVTNVGHQTFVNAGFVDPLVNSDHYKGTSLASNNINVKYSGLNNFGYNSQSGKTVNAPQIVTGSYPIGSYLDYIMTRGGAFTYDTWETVLDLDSSGNFSGVIPSDHNLVTLKLGLP